MMLARRKPTTLPRMSTSPRTSAPLARRLIAPLVVLAFEAALLAAGLGSFAALADPRAIALLVLWGSAGYALQWLQPMRGHDAATTERDPGAMLVLLFAPLLAPMVGAWGARMGWAMLPGVPLVSWIGVALAAIGLTLRIAAMARLGPRFSPLVAVQREHVLETNGLYSRVRHPGYLGGLLACLGSALAFGSALALPLVLLMRLAQGARIRREEALMARTFGEAWADYVRRTGALLPRLGASR